MLLREVEAPAEPLREPFRRSRFLYKQPFAKLRNSRFAPLAQLDRASVYGTEGYRFEPCGVRLWTRGSHSAVVQLHRGRLHFAEHESESYCSAVLKSSAEITSPTATTGGRSRPHDGSILDGVTRWLRRCGYHQLRRITFDFHEGALTQRGIVSSFFLKQLAQAQVANIDGGR